MWFLRHLITGFPRAIMKKPNERQYKLTFLLFLVLSHAENVQKFRFLKKTVQLVLATSLEKASINRLLIIQCFECFHMLIILKFSTTFYQCSFPFISLIDPYLWYFLGNMELDGPLPRRIHWTTEKAEWWTCRQDIT